ncbi:hypothetical protein FDI21_gp178 [Pseudomonas phage Noxifer]|uniref:Uncharacterized protein n=1 Tax=Pseudomonas phage Noxifer TaxID=2006684 RepID=A0A1Y0T390_9CAUD|nr:hypothetical protein FDI21_gp178 [Pseudomonas phage Noxifer]ARV77347.1 hypothetical protein NOXIFER_178 [Pseudomonas phage Noxifer]
MAGGYPINAVADREQCVFAAATLDIPATHVTINVSFRMG